MKKVASLEYGVIFKKAFSDPFVFTSFVRDILGLEIEIETVETGKEFDKPIGPVATKFDLYAEDKKNRIIVEIQRERRADHYDRFLHYHCAALLEQVVQSGDYRPGLRVFTIVVLTAGDKHKRDVAITDFDPRDLKGVPLGEFQHKIVFLCPKYANAETPAQYREWLTAINDSLDGEVEEGEYESPAVLQVFEAILADMVTPHERARMKDEYGDELLKQEKLEEGIALGRQQGLQQGIQQGFEEGAKQTQFETARRLLASGLDTGLIAQATGLSISEVTDLAE